MDRPLLGFGPPRELWRTALCPHGRWHRDCRCCLAHSLSELALPAIGYHCTPADRFFGQIMTREQIAIIGQYWDADTSCRPAWAVALFLLESGLEGLRGYRFSWDFGLLYAIQSSYGASSFEWYPDL